MVFLVMTFALTIVFSYPLIRAGDMYLAGGAYVMGTGDEVPPTAKLDNLKAMVEITEKYGRY